MHHRTGIVLKIVLLTIFLPTLVAASQSTVRSVDLGVFSPGWTTYSPSNVDYQQTYVHPCPQENGWHPLTHRLADMDGNEPFVYINGSGFSINDVLSGALDECYRTVLSLVPDGVIVAPLAEMNGNWTDYAGTPLQAIAAYERIRSLDPGDHVWCGSFTIGTFGGVSADEYLQAVAPYVDYACPSHYDNSNVVRSGEVVALAASAHGASANLPVIVAQTATDSVNKVEWLLDLLHEAESVGNIDGVIYFNSDANGNRYVIPWENWENISW